MALNFFGVGSQTSPIALNDSEDEVYIELYKDSSSSSLPANLQNPPLVPQPKPWAENQWDKKRKRTHTLTSHDATMPGPSAPQRSFTTLENRLSQPESKKARKRRRKAERQALEDARLRNFNWLNGSSPFATGPILPPMSWTSDLQVYPLPQSTDHASLLKSGLITGFTPTPPPSLFITAPEPDDFTLYDNREPHSVSPPPPPSRWVSSMAKAAATDPINSTTEEHSEASQWSPMSTQIPLQPPVPSQLPPPLPIQATNTLNNSSCLNVSSLPKHVEHHALPPKPPPAQPAQIIGMKPDQDPNSKHGIFQLTSATKEAGTDVKKKGPLYMPNPACTLVMEQLPKTHRHPDFINSWSKSACGAQPVHMFIDVPGGKALVEFATAELARRAWASPKLGHAHQGKTREDLIKVWWYRVDGVGAGSGVGEIEEGEIEGDAIEKEVDQPFKKETKKEKKARLAKERAEKKVKRELELKERQTLQQPQAENPINSTSSFAVPENSVPTPLLLSPPWTSNPAQGPTHYLPDVGSWGPIEWERPPPVMSGWIESWGSLTGWNLVQADDLDDYESNMDTDEPQLLYSAPVIQPLPPHGFLPPRSVPKIVAPLPRPAVQRSTPPPLPPPPRLSPPPPTKLALPSPRPLYEAPPPIPQVVAPSPPAPPINPPSRSSSSSSTPSPTSLPSEPRAMKNAPTEPSFTKRALMARQKELEERIAKSKMELAETRAAGSISKPATPISSMQLSDNPIPVKPSMDLGEKQAMEDRLRKLVLQSQKAKGKATLPADNSNVPAATTVAPDVQSISPSISPSSSSSFSSAPSPVVPSNQLPVAQLTTVSLSAHDFSLEDLAVSFITQTIETIKSQPAPTPSQTPTARSSNKPVSTTTQSNNNNNNTTKLELAAKQRRLEQHIMESKNLMTKLAKAQTKEEKDSILKAMREMTRSFEEASQSKTTTMKPKTSASQPSVIISKHSSSTPQGTCVRIWPGSHEDAGVLILSDSGSEDSCESDED